VIADTKGLLEMLDSMRAHVESGSIDGRMIIGLGANDSAYIGYGGAFCAENAAEAMDELWDHMMGSDTKSVSLGYKSGVLQ